MTLNVRRVITANDKDGKAVVSIDDIAGNHRANRPGVSSVLIWTTDTHPPDVTSTDDFGATVVGRPPQKGGGTIFRIIEFQPGNSSEMHVTDTIDYALVMSGELDMELDDGVEVHLRQGDVLVQRATLHDWHNRGTEPCVMAFVLIDAQA